MLLSLKKEKLLFKLFSEPSKGFVSQIKLHLNNCQYPLINYLYCDSSFKLHNICNTSRHCTRDTFSFHLQMRNKYCRVHSSYRNRYIRLWYCLSCFFGLYFLESYNSESILQQFLQQYLRLARIFELKKRKGKVTRLMSLEP